MRADRTRTYQHYKFVSPFFTIINYNIINVFHRFGNFVCLGVFPEEEKVIFLTKINYTFLKLDVFLQVHDKNVKCHFGDSQ